MTSKVASLPSHILSPPPSEFFPARDIPDLTGKTALVTGANTGIGYQTVRELLLKNAKVYLAARSPSKSAEAAEKLKNDTGREPLQLQLDLGDLHSVKRAAQEFLSKEERLDVLFNNAGVMIPPTEQLTTQGYDLQFGTNVIGHYYFTILLLPALQHSTDASGVKARVVNTSSSGHAFAPDDGIDWSVIKGSLERDAKIKEWGTSSTPGEGAIWRLYGMSKMGNILISNLLNRHHGDKVASYSLHPGVISTEIARHGSADMKQSLAGWGLQPSPKGALTQVWAGTMPEAENVVGAYLMPWARIGEADPRAANEKLQDELQSYMDEQIKALDIPKSKA